MEEWPDIHKGVVCGDCYALINIQTYGTCRTYCESLGIECLDAFEDSVDSCTIKSNHDCDSDFNWTSNALCQCRYGTSRTVITTFLAIMP